MFVLPAVACAQTYLDTLQKMYGVDQREFWRAAWVAPDITRRFTDSVTGFVSDAHPRKPMWDFADGIGVTTLRYPIFGDITQHLQFLDLARSDRHRIIMGRGILPITGMDAAHELPPWYDYSTIGFSQQVIFYPFDESRFTSWVNKFLNVYPDAGAVQANDDTSNHHLPGETRNERVMGAELGDVRGEPMASGVVYDYHAVQTHRYPSASSSNRTVQNVDWPFVHQRQHGWVRSWWLNLKGHLFPASPDSIAANTPLLRIEMWHQIAAGETYLANNANAGPAPDDTERLVQTIYVPKSALQRNDPNDSWFKYRDTSFEVPVSTFFATSGSPSKRLDIRIFWEGPEKLALHSVALRDLPSELLLGNTSNSTSFRNQILRGLENGIVVDGKPRPWVIGVASAGEHFLTEVDGIRGFNELLKTNPAFIANGDSLPAYSEDGAMDIIHRIDRYAEIITPELEISGGIGSNYLRDIFKTRWGTLPAIREHNGGRFKLHVEPRDEYIAELPIDASSYTNSIATINDFEVSMNRIGLGGQYAPRNHFLPEPMVPVARPPYAGGRSLLTAFGRMAELARERKRRLIVTLFNTGIVGFEGRQYPPGSNNWYVDTLFSRLPEAPELFALMNIGLAYGAKGVIHQVANSNTNTQSLQSHQGNLWVGFDDSFGITGPGASDTTQNHLERLPFSRSVDSSAPGVEKVWGGYGDSTYQRHIVYGRPYVGWRNRTRATRHMNAWLARLGPHIMPLSWRDAYSIHFTVPQLYTIRHENEDKPLGFRPLPTTEIVDRVFARDPRRSLEAVSALPRPAGGWEMNGYPLAGGPAVLDAPEETYVELGLFNSKPGPSYQGGQLDTHYVFVVNRRVFERPEDVDRASDRGRMMDSVTSMRTVYVRLNLPRFEGLSFVRVREIEGDTTVLTGSRFRRSFDTVVGVNAFVPILLGAGRGALLEISYEPPAEAIGAIIPVRGYNGTRVQRYKGTRVHRH